MTDKTKRKAQASEMIYVIVGQEFKVINGKRHYWDGKYWRKRRPSRRKVGT